ncbi:MAG: relaxase/mobilization nuclease domain-containing protein [Methylococcales bacterium]
MIFDSNVRRTPKPLAKHLKSGENEKVTITGNRGILESLNVDGAFAEMAAIGEASRTSRYLYHVSASPGQSLDKKQWEKTWALYEKVQGLQEQNYIEVEHEKKGRVHRHRVYLRVDPFSGKSVQLSYTKIKNERIARELEYEFRHPILTGRHTKSVIRYLSKEKGNDALINILEKSLQKEKPVAQMNHAERQMTRRGMGVGDHKRHIYDAWCEHEQGKSFEEELQKRGLFLAMGDKAVMAVSFEGVDLPVLRSINYFHRKVNVKTVTKRDLDEAIGTEIEEYEKLKERRKLVAANIKADFFDDLEQEKITIFGYAAEKSKVSSHRLQKYIKSTLGAREMLYRSPDGSIFVGTGKKFTMDISSNKIILAGKESIVNNVGRVIDIAKFNQWKSVKIESSKLKYKQYYVDTMAEMIVPNISTNSSKESKKQTNTVDEIELVTNDDNLLRHRKVLLFDEYFEELEKSELADHWVIKKLPNGYIRFENDSGSFVDKGNKISVEATRGNFKSCTQGALMLAKFKKWKIIRVKGTNDFKFNVYKQAHDFGIEVQKDNDYDAGLMKKVITELENKARQTKNEPKTPEVPKEVLSPKKPPGPGM